MRMTLVKRQLDKFALIVTQSGDRALEPDFFHRVTRRGRRVPILERERGGPPPAQLIDRNAVTDRYEPRFGARPRRVETFGRFPSRTKAS